MNEIKCILLLCIGLLSGVQLRATHIIGGELIYDCLGSNTYRLTLKVYRDCSPGTAMYDDPAYLTIWDGGGSPNFIDTTAVSFPGAIVLPFVSSDTCFLPPLGVCVEEAVYITIVTLPSSITGYVFVYQRCCRNASITNIPDPANTGKTFFEAVPATYLCNNSPRFNQPPPIAMCANRPFSFSHAATDPDGDSLAYSICPPYIGADLGLSQPVISSPPPFVPLTFSPPHTFNNPITGAPSLAIDAVTGELTITPTQIGQFVVGICCNEYRDGILIGSHFRDFEFNVTDCSLAPNCNVGLSAISVLNIQIIPNPSTDFIQILAEQNIHVAVFDMMGKMVYHSSSELELHTISTEIWASGMYSYRVFSGNGMSAGKFLKQ